MALVHTACGRSESKYLRPTLAGHVEGCPVIALCRPGSPRRAGRGPVSCDSGPSSLATQQLGRGTGHRDAPSPPLAPTFPLGHPEDPAPPVSGTVWPGIWGSLPLLPPALQLGGGVEVGGASATRPLTGSQVGGGVRSRLQRRFSRRGKQRGPWPRRQQYPTEDPAHTLQDVGGSCAGADHGRLS